MGAKFKAGEWHYFPLHGVGLIIEVGSRVLKVNFRGIITSVEEVACPAYSDDYCGNEAA